MTNTTAAQPLDLDKLEALAKDLRNLRGFGPEHFEPLCELGNGTLALIAQARAAQPAGAAALIRPGEKWSRGADSEGNEDIDELACAGINIDTEDFPHQNAVEFYAEKLGTAQARRDAVLSAIQKAAGAADTAVSASDGAIYEAVSSRVDPKGHAEVMAQTDKLFGRATLAPVAAQQAAACGSYVCHAASQGGIICAEGECDIASGVRAAKAPAAQAVDANEGLRLCDHLIHTDGRNARSMACDLRPKVEAAMLASPARTPDASQQAAITWTQADNLRRTLRNIKDATRLADVRSLASLGLGFLDVETQAAAVAVPSDDGIRGPLTDEQRDEVRCLYNNIKHLESGGYYVADDVIRKAAVYGYMNGRHDFAAPAPAVAATTSEDARDAARYQWLKANIQPEYDLPGGMYLPDDEPELWDDTIDAAMRAIQQEGK